MNSDILSNLVITQIYSASTMYTEENKKMKRSNRPNWAIVLKYEGETMYRAKGKSYISNISNMVILPKGCSYEWTCTASGHFSIIEFDCDKTFDGIFSFTVKDGEKFLKLFKDLEYIYTLKKPMYKMEGIRDCYSIILKLVQSKQQRYLPTNKQQKIAPAVDYIAKNYNQSIKNDELAQLTGLSTVYFRKLFAEVFKTSPIAYIHELRIKKAKEMLRSDFDSISIIAQTLGYNSIYDFSRTFKKHTGVSPTGYLKKDR